MKKYYKFYLIILPLINFSCSSSNLIYLDCVPGPDEFELGTNIVSYSYNSSTKSAKLVGKIYDDDIKEPIINADITLLPCGKNTISDNEGIFNFGYKPSECDSLKLSFVGYFDKTFSLKKLVADYVSTKKSNK